MVVAGETDPGFLKRLAGRVLRDDLFRDSSVLLVATVVSGGINYAYQVAMGRLLGPEGYGVFGSLFGLFYMVMIFSAGVGYVSTRYSSRLSGEELSGFLRGFGVRVLLLTLFVFLLFAAASPYVAGFLRIDDPLLVVLVGVAPLFGITTASNKGTLKGLQRFVHLGSFNAGTAGAKLVLGVALVLLGFGVYGAIGAVAASSLLVLVATTLYLRGLYLSPGDFDGYDGVYRYALPSLLTAFCFTVPANADVMLVKHLFTSTQAGLYTSVSVFGKVLIFLPIGVSSAMFPKVSATEGETTHLLRRALLYTAGLGAVGVAAFSLFPEPLLTLFFGGAYGGAAALLPWYGLAIGVFSLALVVLNYSLARHEEGFVRAFTVLTGVELGLIYVFSASMLQIVQAMLAVNAAALGLGLYLFLWREAT